MKEYYDAYSRALFMAFERELKPLIERIAPDWIFHHIVIDRRKTNDLREEVVISLVIKPIGDARFGDSNTDLQTGPKRLGRM